MPPPTFVPRPVSRAPVQTVDSSPGSSNTAPQALYVPPWQYFTASSELDAPRDLTPAGSLLPGQTSVIAQSADRATAHQQINLGRETTSNMSRMAYAHDPASDGQTNSRLWMDASNADILNPGYDIHLHSGPPDGRTPETSSAAHTASSLSCLPPMLVNYAIPVSAHLFAKAKTCRITQKVAALKRADPALFDTVMRSILEESSRPLDDMNSHARCKYESSMLNYRSYVPHAFANTPESMWTSDMQDSDKPADEKPAEEAAEEA